MHILFYSTEKFKPKSVYLTNDTINPFSPSGLLYEHEANVETKFESYSF